MKILGDSQITNATITATNLLAASFADKLKTYPLADNLRTLSNSTVIDLDFGTDKNPIDTISICGSNLTATSTMSVSYSDTNILSPDATVSMTIFSTLNQVVLLPTALSKRYWRISLSDSAVSKINIGFMYIGAALNIDSVEFGHGASLNIFSNYAVSKTGQGFGSKTYNALPVDFTMYLDYTDLESYLAIKQANQNIDPVLLIEYPESYDSSLYRPKYGVLSGTEIPYPMVNNPLSYVISDRLEERF